MPPAEGESGAGAADTRLVHFSTGRLTRRQAELVDAWRARLREDRPLPGQRRVGAAARLLGVSDRPRASCSDAIAAAVAELLARDPPAPLGLARYAYAGAQAGGGAGGAEQACPPVSWYLPGDLASAAEQLRAAARKAARQVHDQVRAAAYDRHPGGTRAAGLARGLFVAGELARLRLPSAGPVPRGAIARLAIDRWAGRGPEEVVADAVSYAARVHLQPHRARADMRTLSR